MAVTDSIESLSSVTDKMLRVIGYVFEKLEKVTPLMLKIFFNFIQGIYSALYGRLVFEEDCRAWVYDPAYLEVYELFRISNITRTMMLGLPCLKELQMR